MGGLEFGGSGFRLRDAAFRGWVWGLWVQGSEFRVPASGSRLQPHGHFPLEVLL